MSEAISILLLEDNSNDAELLKLTLKSGGVEAVVVHSTSGAAFLDALNAGSPDLIISDYSIPSYSGKAALDAAQRVRPDVPFIFFSGTIGEEAAIEALKWGATDYILKDKPMRLVPAIHRALEDREQTRQRREAEKKILNQAQLLDLATDAIIVRDLDDRVEFWNQGAERLYGFSRAEIIGKKATEFIPPAAHGVFNEAKRTTLAGGQWQGEMEHLTKDGKQVVVISRWTLVKNESGEPDRVLAINSDITENKRLEKQFLRAQRLESVGTLASAIAHDLNNILTPILGACEFLKEEQKSREAADILDMAFKSAERGASLVHQLLTFVKGGEGKRSRLQTETILGEICAMLKKTLPKNITLKADIQDDLWPIEADPTQLHQVLMNLCVNARDAMPNGGPLTVIATNAPDQFVRIRVQDSGTGIPPEVMDNIFDPFFTTKEPGKGTGLGLSTVAKIIKNHGGSINVESEVGSGTTFEIELPAASRRETSIGV
jgi:two-component system, cell cycle sensor histidine kinase and response regulator CckA